MKAREFITERFDDFEYPIPGFDEPVYVRYDQGNIFIVGYDISGGFVDRYGDMADIGTFDFEYNITTGATAFTNVSDADYKAFFDDNSAMDIVEDIAAEFVKEYGIKWSQIYAKLHKTRRPGTEADNNIRRYHRYDRFKMLSDQLYKKKNLIKSRARIQLKRKGGTPEQLARLSEIDSMSRYKWYELLSSAVHSEKEKWADLDNIGTDLMAQLIDKVSNEIVEKAIDHSMALY